MRVDNTRGLRDLFIAAEHPELLVYEFFEVDAAVFTQMYDVVRRQHSNFTLAELRDRTAFRVILAQQRIGQPKPRVRKRLGIRFWIIVAAIIAAGILMSLRLHAEPIPQNYLQAYRNSVRSFVLAQVQTGQPMPLILRFQQAGSTLATRSAGLVTFNCTTNMTCSWSGSTLTLTSSGGSGGGCTPPGTSGDILTDNGSGGCSEISKVPVTLGGTNLTTLTAHAVYVGNGTSAPTALGTGNAGQVLESNGGSSDPSFQDPIVSGPDAVGVTPTKNPVQTGCLFLTTPATLTNNQVGATQCDSGQRTIVTGAGGIFPVTGTFWQTTQPVSGTFWQATQPVSGTFWPYSLGQNTMANSVPVTIASNQSGVPVTGTFWQTTQPVSGTFWQTTQPVSCTAANCPVNEAQWGGANVNGGNGTSGAGDPRTNLASDNTAIANWGQGATGSAVPSGAQQIGGDGSGNLTAPLMADGYAFYDASTNGATQLVALVSGKTIYVLGYSFSSSSTTANTLKLVYGTGTNCATGQTAMTPGVVTQAPTSTGPIGKVIPVSGWSKGLKTAASNELCILTNAAAAAQVEVWYTQF